jgi:hypothetical protein
MQHIDRSRMEWLQLFVILLALELPAEDRHKYPSSITPAGQLLKLAKIFLRSSVI